MDTLWTVLVASGFWAIVSVAVGFLSYLLAKKRYLLDEKVDLRIRVGPTMSKDGKRQMAYFVLHNVGKRPVNVGGWGYARDNSINLALISATTSYEVDSFGSICTNTVKDFPVLLKEQESCDFWVYIDRIPTDQITKIFIEDVGKNIYAVDDDMVNQFRSAAHRGCNIKARYEMMLSRIKSRKGSNFSKQLIAALRETNEAIARGEKLTVREYRITVVRTKTLSGGRKRK